MKIWRRKVSMKEQLEDAIAEIGSRNRHSHLMSHPTHVAPEGPAADEPFA
jgi:hypothetical protein